MSRTEKFLVLAIVVVIVILSQLGCIKTTRIVYDKEGREVERVEESSWPPPVVVYDGPVVYRRPVYVSSGYYYPHRTVVRSYPVYTYERPVRVIHTGHHHHYRHCD